MIDPMLPAGTNYCLCVPCGAYFGGERAYALHRVGPVGNRACLPPHGMREAGFRLDPSGYWRRQAPDVATVRRRVRSEAAT